MKIINNVYETRQYSKLCNAKVNRDIDKAYLVLLKENMKEHGQIDPITVMPLNGSGIYEITDGGHRFRGCKELGLPVKFIVDSNANKTNQVKRMVSVNRFNKTMNLSAYAKIYAISGNRNYVEFLKFRAAFPKLRDNASLYFLGIGGGEKTAKSINFKDGKFVIKNLNMVYRCATDAMEVVNNILPYQKKKSIDAKFSAAFSEFWQHPKYKQAIMIKSAKKNKFYYRWDGMNNIRLFRALLLEVYNDSLGQKNRIK